MFLKTFFGEMIFNDYPAKKVIAKFNLDARHEFILKISRMPRDINKLATFLSEQFGKIDRWKSSVIKNICFNSNKFLKIIIFNF
jgi:hypothetical protein